jgi:hypothetical protein
MKQCCRNYLNPMRRQPRPIVRHKFVTAEGPARRLQYLEQQQQRQQQQQTKRADRASATTPPDGPVPASTGGGGGETMELAVDQIIADADADPLSPSEILWLPKIEVTEHLADFDSLES